MWKSETMHITNLHLTGWTVKKRTFFKYMKMLTLLRNFDFERQFYMQNSCKQTFSLGITNDRCTI